MNVARARLVAGTMGRLITGEVGRTVGLRRSVLTDDDERPGRQQQRARAVRQALESLGPLYIKAGQMLSTRPDICPEYRTLAPEVQGEVLRHTAGSIPANHLEAQRPRRSLAIWMVCISSVPA